MAMPKEALKGMIALVNKQPTESLPTLSKEELIFIETQAARLANRQLKGHAAQDESVVLQLPPEEIDISRALFLTQLGNSPEALLKIRTYEATLDLMALQIMARLPSQATPEAKIAEISRYIFHELHFRFPPHSLYAKEIDLYTFLPSVLDSRRGVCLGVSILYLSLAQRLQLTLEMVTPPGHIYVRYRNGDRIINIETTARGIHLDNEEYLGIDTRSLQMRTLKEVVGLAHFNHASTYLQEQDFEMALASYQKAVPYLPDDPLLKQLMGFTSLLVGQIDQGKEILNRIQDWIPEDSVSKDTVAEDYLNGDVDIEGVRTLFIRVDETRESILQKKEQIEKVLQTHPHFRSGWFQLAVTWLQLHREGEALKALETYHSLWPDDASAEYYLSILYAERLNYPKAWEHLFVAERLCQARDHDPKALRYFRRELTRLSPP
jgi:tetratricopeptide (TPR) repeat protein